MARTSVVNPGNSINDQVPASPRKRSKFSLPYLQMGTSRFGEVGVCYVNDTVPGDHFQNINYGKVDTLSFKAPLDDSVRRRRDFFFCPYSAILPRTWERMITQPNIGADIPRDAGTGFIWPNPTDGQHAAFSKMMTDTFVNAFNFTGTASAMPSNSKHWVYWQFYTMIIAELFYSSGSLLNELGFPMQRYFQDQYDINTTESTSIWTADDTSFDKFFDEFCSFVLEHVVSMRWRNTALGKDVVYYFQPRKGMLEDDLNFRDFLDDMRDGILVAPTSSSNRVIEFVEGEDYTDYADAFVAQFNKPITITVGEETVTKNTRKVVCGAPNGTKMNLARIWAYQLCNAHFYSNDHIDFVYSANLYRENMLGFLSAKQVQLKNPLTYYNLNGVVTHYEPLSAHFLEHVMSYPQGGPDYGFSWGQDAILQYFTMIFSHRRSLKYMDYFTGARTSPLAVGNVQVPVQGSSYVNVVDITQNILMQRFLNAVNRSGRKISNYIGELFGVSPKKDICDPAFLVHYDDSIGSVTIENTGAAQMTDSNSQTSRLVGSGRFEVSFDADAFGVIIGLSYYDYVRKYAYATDPLFRKVDRFDLFNPFLENVGDQPIAAIDVDNFFGVSDGNFGYQQRYMEYKQTFPRVTGGFVENLPGFTFVTKNKSMTPNINVCDIRSRSRELDPYFLSLTGYSLGSYFHFINRNESSCEVTRDMSTDAQIL